MHRSSVPGIQNELRPFSLAKNSFYRHFEPTRNEKHRRIRLERSPHIALSILAQHATRRSRKAIRECFETI
jgi:hypothetical protein